MKRVKEFVVLDLWKRTCQPPLLVQSEKYQNLFEGVLKYFLIIRHEDCDLRDEADVGLGEGMTQKQIDDVVELILTK